MPKPSLSHFREVCLLAVVSPVANIAARFHPGLALDCAVGVEEQDVDRAAGEAAAVVVIGGPRRESLHAVSVLVAAAGPDDA